MRMFLPPWEGDPALYPASALERHSAHCRKLDLLDSAHPSEVKPLLTPEIREYGDRAVEQFKKMESWYPLRYNKNNHRRVKDDILEGNFRHYAFFGGRGGSKSHDAGEAIIELASTDYERVVCGREFMASIRDSSRSLLVQKIKASKWATQWTITDRELKNNATGSLITFLGINRNPDSARSLEGCTIFFGEEAEAFSKDSLEILLPTIRAPGSRCIWLWNPAEADSPMNQMFLAGEPPERSFIRCVLSEDNRWFYRTEMPAERRQSFNTDSDAKFRHIWRGALDANPDLAVFNNWTIGRVDISNTDLMPRYGIDWGWTDPLAIVELYVIEPDDPEMERGKIYISAEIYGQHIPARTIPGLIDQVMPLARDHTMRADNAEPKSIEDLNAEGFFVVGAKKGPGSIRAGISLMQSYDIVVSPDCPNIQSELMNWKWKTTKHGVVLRDPEDKDNHGMDGCRYALEDYTPPSEEGDVIYI